MKVLVTGATGFLGKFVVESAVVRGHQVRAVVRPSTTLLPAWWEENPLVEIVRGDLRNRHSIPAMVEEIDTVVHLAAAKAGGLYEQFSGTVSATENLVAEMVSQGIQRIVLCSTFSVYEYLGRWSWSLLTEDSPLVREPRERDEYSQTKLLQEKLVRTAAADHGWRCIVLRPGVVFGPDNLWSARLGQQLSETNWVRIGSLAPVPLTYVENCASAFVKAIEYSGPDRELVLNVVDDETPSQRAYLNAMRQATGSRARIVPVPWLVLRCFARAAAIANTVLFRGTGKLPGLLRPAALHARCKPLRYSNEKLRATLDWSPQFTTSEGLRRSVEPVDQVR